MYYWVRIRRLALYTTEHQWEQVVHDRQNACWPAVVNVGRVLWMMFKLKHCSVRCDRASLHRWLQRRKCFRYNRYCVQRQSRRLLLPCIRAIKWKAAAVNVCNYRPAGLWLTARNRQQHRRMGPCGLERTSLYSSPHCIKFAAIHEQTKMSIREAKNNKAVMIQCCEVVDQAWRKDDSRRVDRWYLLSASGAINETESIEQSVNPLKPSVIRWLHFECSVP